MSEIRLFVQVFGFTILFLTHGEETLFGQDSVSGDLPPSAPLMIGEVPAEGLPQTKKNGIPVQSLPPPIQPIADPGTIYNLGPDTNLVRLLNDIRDLSKNGELDSAQSLAGRALEKISRTEENSFYLRQIRKEERNLFQKGKPSDERQELFAC